MGSIHICNILLSRNAKTGCSVNVDQCSPTPWCEAHCYRRWRNEETIEANGWTSTPNVGPITWRTQQAAYRRNEAAIIAASQVGDLDEVGARIAAMLPRLGLEYLRGNGTGDSFPELCELYARVGHHGGKVYLYSRRPAMIRELAALHDALDGERPFVLGSVDPSTPEPACKALVEATRCLNGKPALAYATDTKGAAALLEIDEHPCREHFQVVFGYHSSFMKTRLDHPLECPATAGLGAHCQDCRLCFTIA